MRVPLALFQETVWRYYHQHGRHDLPWRQAGSNGQFNPYHIVVSELMLQQTQVGRVIPKYELFIQAYPGFAALAAAPLADVIRLWSGLGYNRRAKFLWQAAEQVMRQHGGALPRTQTELVALPGIGPHTAGAIRAYAFNEPAMFIETNIRTAYIHHFFGSAQKVSDTLLAPLIADTIPPDNPREWYWALMDYGTHLKQTVGNLSRASTAYAKQSVFQGSRRQIRGQVLRALAAEPHTIGALQKTILDVRLQSVVDDLTQEAFIERKGSRYQLRA